MNAKHFVAGVAVGTLLTIAMPTLFGTAVAQDPEIGPVPLLDEDFDTEDLIGPTPEEVPPIVCPPCPPCPKAKDSDEVRKALEAIQAVEQLEQQQQVQQ